MCRTEAWHGSLDGRDLKLIGSGCTRAVELHRWREKIDRSQGKPSSRGVVKFAVVFNPQLEEPLKINQCDFSFLLGSRFFLSIFRESAQRHEQPERHPHPAPP